MLGIRIGVVSVIILVIAGIFIFKSLSSKNTAPEINKGSVSDSSNTVSETIPLKISEVNLDKIKSYKMPFVIDFGSDQCIHCKQMAPVLETLNKEWQGKAIVQFVDVWKYTTAANNFPVSIIPTQVFYNADGTPYVPSESIQKSIEFTMYSDKTTGKHIFTVHQGGITEAQMRQIFAEMGLNK
jgi:thioredoxin 1